MAWTERYVSVAGAGAHDGTSEANAWTLAEAITAAPGTGTRLNVKKGTYTNTTTGRALSLAGSTTAPIWWRGYDTTIGDRDTDPTLTPPLISFTTGLLTVGGSHQILSHLDVVGANTGRQLNLTGANILFDRVRVENTNAAAGSHAVANATSATNVFLRSWFKATASATRVVLNAIAAEYHGCVVTGGGVGLESAQAVLASHCLFDNCGGHGFQAITTGSISRLLGCTFYSCGGDGVRLDVLPASFIEIFNCLFVENAGYGINNNSGANTNVVKRLANGFYNNSSGTVNGFGDSPALSQIIETAMPLANPAGGDFALVAGALSRGNGQPGLFENTSVRSYLDIGAVQRPETVGDLLIMWY